MTLTYGTLSTVPVFPVDVALVRRSAATPTIDGGVQRRQLRSSYSRQTTQPQTRRWRLTFGPEGEAGLLATFDAAKGGALPVLWTPPAPDDSAAIPVRFLTDSLVVRRGPGPVFEAEVELEEVT